MSDDQVTDPNNIVEPAPTEPSSDVTIESPQAPLTRDDARAAIFATKAKSTPFVFNGVPVELRELSVDSVLNFQQSVGDDRKVQVAQMLINYVFLPNGGPPLFESGDVDAILELPFNADILKIQGDILALMGAAPTDDTKSPAAE